jgi:hypothetical protein
VPSHVSPVRWLTWPTIAPLIGFLVLLQAYPTAADHAHRAPRRRAPLARGSTTDSQHKGQTLMAFLESAVHRSFTQLGYAPTTDAFAAPPAP